MVRIFLLSFTVLSLIFGGVAFAQTNEDTEHYKACKICGMDRAKFDFSRMLIEYDDGTVSPLVSIHCAAIDLASNIDKEPKSIKAADFYQKKLIDAETAFWVVGGKKPGIMSKRGKWAFEKKEDAEKFMSTNGGSLATFEDAMKMAYEDMYEDTKMIREKEKSDAHESAGAKT